MEFLSGRRREFGENLHQFFLALTTDCRAICAIIELINHMPASITTGCGSGNAYLKNAADWQPAAASARGSEMSLPATWNIRFSIQMLNLRNNSADSVLFRPVLVFRQSRIAPVCHLADCRKGKELLAQEQGVSLTDVLGEWIVTSMGVSSTSVLIGIATGIELDMRGWQPGGLLR